MSDSDKDWLSCRETLQLIEGFYSADGEFYSKDRAIKTIINRLVSGSIYARCLLFEYIEYPPSRFDLKLRNSVECTLDGNEVRVSDIIRRSGDRVQIKFGDGVIPRDFWSDVSRPDSKLDADWVVGDFEFEYVEGCGLSRGRIHGVSFNRLGLPPLGDAPLLPFDHSAIRELADELERVKVERDALVTRVAELEAVNATPSGKGGRKPKSTWPEFVAEVVLYYHEFGISVGGDSSVNAVEKEVSDRLSARGIEGPGLTQAKDAISAVFRHLKASGN